jgi:PhzF family phenazine biosynthesis protein
MRNIFQVDAFTQEPFKGNPAGVVLLLEERTEEWMQNLASEMNLSETAFLLKYPGKYSLRWFTPRVEVDLCGHATLASAHILYTEELAAEDEMILFDTKSGYLKSRFKEGWIELDFPAFQVKEEKITEPIKIALGFEPAKLFQSDVNLLVEMDSFESVKNYQPDFEKLAGLPYQGLIITSRMQGDFDFASRYLAPRVGINEDPVTGSAHCSLAPFWSSKLRKDNFRAYQASDRGGELKVRLNDDRVFIQGQAVTVFKGELQV